MTLPVILFTDTISCRCSISTFLVISWPEVAHSFVFLALWRMRGFQPFPSLTLCQNDHPKTYFYVMCLLWAITLAPHWPNNKIWTPKISLPHISSCVLASYCCVTNYHELGCLKWLPFTSQCLCVGESEHDLAWFSAAESQPSCSQGIGCGYGLIRRSTGDEFISNFTPTECISLWLQDSLGY